MKTDETEISPLLIACTNELHFIFLGEFHHFKIKKKHLMNIN